MSIIKTQKHEMEYNPESRQMIFNGRNYTSASSTGGIPPRMIVAANAKEEESWVIDGVTYKHRIDGVNNNFEAGHWYDLDGNDLGTSKPQDLPYIRNQDMGSNKIKISVVSSDYSDFGQQNYVTIFTDDPYQSTLDNGSVEISETIKTDTLNSAYFTAAYFDKTTNDGGILYFNLVSD